MQVLYTEWKFGERDAGKAGVYGLLNAALHCSARRNYTLEIMPRHTSIIFFFYYIALQFSGVVFLYEFRMWSGYGNFIYLMIMRL